MMGLRVELDVVPGFCEGGVVLWEDGRMDVPPDFDRFVRTFLVSAARGDAGEYWHAYDWRSKRASLLTIKVRHGGNLLPSPVPVDTFRIKRDVEVVEVVEGPADGQG